MNDPVHQELRNELWRKVQDIRAMVPKNNRESKLVNDIVCLWALFDMLYDDRNAFRKANKALSLRIDTQVELLDALRTENAQLQAQLDEMCSIFQQHPLGMSRTGRRTVVDISKIFVEALKEQEARVLELERITRELPQDAMGNPLIPHKSCTWEIRYCPKLHYRHTFRWKQFDIGGVWHVSGEILRDNYTPTTCTYLHKEDAVAAAQAALDASAGQKEDA